MMRPLRQDDRSVALQKVLAARYGGWAPATGAVWSETLELLLGHRSFRAYDPSPLEDGTLEAIIAAAQSAASSSNLQTWSVVSISDPDRKARISELSGDQAPVQQAPLLLVFLADLSRARRLAQAANAPSPSLDYLESFLVSAIDAGLAAQNAAVAAESLGLGTVYIGAIRNRPIEVAAELNLPPLAVPLFGLCIGRPAPNAVAAIKPRLPQAVVLHRESYNVASQAEEIAHYDAITFQAAQGLPQTGWSDLVRKRVSSPDQLKGRERLRRALNALGVNLL